MAASHLSMNIVGDKYCSAARTKLHTTSRENVSLKNLQCRVFGKCASSVCVSASARAKFVRCSAIQQPDPGTETLEDQEKPSSTTIRACFKLYRKCAFGQEFHICGDHEAFGSWDADKAFPLTWTEGDIWVGEIEFQCDREVQFKYLLKGKRGELLWQPGRNRIINPAMAEDGVVRLRKPWFEGEVVPEEDDDNGELNNVVKQSQNGSLNGTFNGQLVHDTAANGSTTAPVNGVASEVTTNGAVFKGVEADVTEGEVPGVTEAIVGEVIAEEKIPVIETVTELELGSKEGEISNGLSAADGNEEGEEAIEPKDKPMLNVMEKDLEWGRSIWAGLVRSLGRSPLMDEEKK